MHRDIIHKFPHTHGVGVTLVLSTIHLKPIDSSSDTTNITVSGTRSTYNLNMRSESMNREQEESFLPQSQDEHPLGSFRATTAKRLLIISLAFNVFLAGFFVNWLCDVGKRKPGDTPETVFGHGELTLRHTTSRFALLTCFDSSF
jgi:hypothetical protein